MCNDIYLLVIFFYIGVSHQSLNSSCQSDPQQTTKISTAEHQGVIVAAQVDKAFTWLLLAVASATR